MTRPKPPHCQIVIGLLITNCDVYQKLWKHLYTENVRYCFLYCLKNIFYFSFIDALDLKGILNICRGKIELARTCSISVNAWEKRTTHLKLAVDNINLRLCDPHDYFACPLPFRCQRVMVQ